VAVLFTTDPLFLEHDPGPWHPERAARLDAVLGGVEGAHLDEDLVRFAPVPAPRARIERVHPGRFVTALEELSRTGGGPIDADTAVSECSFDAAVLAAGAGLEAVRRLEAGEGTAAFCAVRPPGHHATPGRAMGFCLLNNVAIVATSLADRGERVLVVDIDAHHGNGTQDVFWADDRVVYVSLHEYPLYPGTGALDEMGAGPGFGATVNVPLPAGATGDVFRRALDDVVAPMAARWQPTWLLVSVGYDAHRRDPLTGLALSSGDYADCTGALAALVPAGRTVLFLEGGYDLEAVRHSVTATLTALVGAPQHPEAPTSGGDGRVAVDAVLRLRAAHGLP
jgi:acetoin utilization deacetylase AcuC-like enzyme